jgi:hypothetical protein
MPILDQLIKKVVVFSAVRDAQNSEPVQRQPGKKLECPDVAVVFPAVRLGTGGQKQGSSTSAQVPDLRNRPLWKRAELVEQSRGFLEAEQDLAQP